MVGPKGFTEAHRAARNPRAPQSSRGPYRRQRALHDKAFAYMSPGNKYLMSTVRKLGMCRYVPMFFATADLAPPSLSLWNVFLPGHDIRRQGDESWLGPTGALS
jgi:hypothetical protein